MAVQRFFCVFLGFLALFITQAGFAATEAETSGKERLVLMPLRVDAADEKMRGAFEVALIEGLTQKYEVFAGEKVRQKAKEVFERESASANEVSRDCDETRCLQNIAAAFQAELVAIANVSRDDNGFIVTLSITNIFDEKSVYSKSLPCPGCGNFQVIKKLKEISGMTVKEEVKHYNWAIGASTLQATGGSGASFHVDYDMSDMLNWPISLRFGLKQFQTSELIPTVGGSNTLTHDYTLTHLSANYVFLADNEFWHPFMGVGYAVKSIMGSCTTPFGGKCFAQDQNATVGIATLGLQYSLSPSFALEIAYYIDSDQNKKNVIGTTEAGVNFRF